MSVHRMPPQDEPFDPRLAALAHAAAAGRAVGNAGPKDGFGQNPIMLDAGVLAEFANAVACGLVYVGDRVAAAAERPMAREAFADRLVKALTAIRDHEEHPGSGPPDDEMREIAREALS